MAEYQEYEGDARTAALLAAITDEPLPQEALDDPEFMAEHRSAVADVAALREQLLIMGDSLAVESERSRAAAPVPPRSAKAEAKPRKPAARSWQPRRYAGTVVPIVLGYTVAHYFSLLALDGQTTWILASNPFGLAGVDLFGTYGNTVDLTAVGPDAIALVAERWRPWLGAALIAALYVDATSFGSRFAAVREAAVDDQEDRRAIADLGDVSGEFRVYDEFVMEQRPGSRLRVRDFRGYPSGDPFDDARYAQVRAR